MKYTEAEIEEARRLAVQAESQVEAQLSMIRRMQQSAIPTAVAEEALRTMRRIVDQMNARLKTMIGPVKGD